MQQSIKLKHSIFLKKKYDLIHIKPKTALRPYFPKPNNT